MRIVYVLPILGAIAAAFVMLLVSASAGSAPQEAAGYAMACALAVVPYVFARAVIALFDDSPRVNTDRIVAAFARGPDTTQAVQK